MPHGGMHNGRGSCPPGQHMMPDGTCMPGSYHGALPGQYRKGGNIKRMPHGGPHNGNGNGIASTNECPHGNRSVNHLGQTICI